MPELPEVEAARRNLERWTGGREVVNARVVDPAVVRRGLSTSPSDAVADAGAALAPALGPCGALTRRGKRLAWRLGGLGLLVHLGMTGRWARRAVDDPPRAARLGVMLDDGATLWFCDARRFGCVAVVPPGSLDAALVDGLGPDALDPWWTGARLRAALRGRAPIKPALLDQARIAGLGNIHAAEALFRARVPPSLPCDALDPSAADRLVDAIRAQLAEALVEVASDEIVYLSDGGVDNPFAVYGREGEACRRCGGTIARFVQAGRSTFWCPACQARDAEPALG